MANYQFDTNQMLKIIRTKKGLDKQKTFLRSKKLSMGIQMLKKGDDYKEPVHKGGKYKEPEHKHGEVYFALKGYARLRIGKKDYRVSPGMAMFVPAGVPHEFYGVKKEFVFLFIFAGLDE